MVHEEVFREPIFRAYRAPSCSWASFYTTIINILRIFLPLLIIFCTHGLWKKFGTFAEFPRISFDGSHVLWATTANSTLIASTFAVLNAAAENLETSQFTHYFQDLPGSNQKSLNIDVRLHTGKVSVESVTYLLFARLQLDYHSIVDTQLVLSDTIQLTSASEQALVYARLDVDQSEPLLSRLTTTLVDYSRVDVDHFQPMAILERSLQQPMALRLTRKTQFFVSLSPDSTSFLISLRLNISEMLFAYKTDFWELIKWAWIQYFAVYYVVDHLLNSITSYLFANHVFYVIDSANKY